MSLATPLTKPTKIKTKQRNFTSATTNQQSLKAQSLSDINPDILLLPAEHSQTEWGITIKVKLAGN